MRAGNVGWGWRLRRWRRNKHLHTLVDNGGSGGDGKNNGSGWMRFQLALSTCRVRGLRVCVVVVHVVGAGLAFLSAGLLSHSPQPSPENVKLSRYYAQHVCVRPCVCM